MLMLEIFLRRFLKDRQRLRIALRNLGMCMYIYGNELFDIHVGMTTYARIP